MGGDQQTSRPIQGIVPAAAAAEGVVLGAPAHLVDAVVGQADDVERVGDLAGPRERCFEGAPVGAGEVQHAPVDAPAPHLGLREEPRGGAFGVATRDNVEQLAPLHIDDRGAPVAGAPPAVTPEQRLIEAQSLHRSHPLAVGGQQRLTPDQHRPVGGVPVATQLGGHIRHRAGVAAHSQRRPARRPRRQRAPSGRDLVVDLGERRDRAVHRRTVPAPFVPDQAHRAPERRQIHQRHRGCALGHTDPPQPPHVGRARLRMCSANGPPGASSTPSTSTSPRPTINSQIRVGFSSTGGLLE